jgi:septum site-determining protein MinD
MIPASLKMIPLKQFERAFSILMEQLKKEFDYCLIDCPAGIEQGFQFATSVADRAILLTTPHISAVKDASRVLHLLNGTKITKVELIINEYDERLVRKKYMLSKEDISELFDIPVLGTIPHDEKIIVSQNKGVPVVTMRSKATQKFIYLSKQIGVCAYDFS